MPSLAADGDSGDDLFYTEISKYSEDISAHAQRINSSQLQCKNCLMGLVIFIFLLLERAFSSGVFSSSQYLYVQVILLCPNTAPLSHSALVQCHCPCLSSSSHFTACNVPLSPAMFSPHSCICFGW